MQSKMQICEAFQIVFASWITALLWRRALCNLENSEPCHAGPSKTGHNEEFWQKVLHWVRECWTTLVFLLPEHKEQFEN